MSKHNSHPTSPAAGAPKVPPRRSGRVQFDERGQAIWAWAVETGMFDLNASTQRVRALSEATMTLELTEAAGTAKTASTATAPRKGEALTPYERPTPQAAARHGAKTTDPYGRSQARPAEPMTFNPYDRTPTRRR